MRLGGRSQWRHGLAIFGFVSGLVLVGTLAWAYWSGGGAGTASGAVGALDAPSTVTASTTGSQPVVVVAWAPVDAPDGGNIAGYFVQRVGGSAPFAACSSAPDDLLVAGTTTCEDDAVPPGTYTYTVTAVYRSWTATSAPSNPTTVDAVTHFTVSTPAATAAGVPFSVTLTALDAANNPVSNYTGTVHFTTSDPGVTTLPADYAFAADDAGAHTFVDGASLATAGSQTVNVKDIDDTTITGSSMLTVTAGTAAQLAFLQQPSGGTSSTAWGTQPKIAIQDAFGNNVTSASASVALAITTGTGASGAVLTCTANPKTTGAGTVTFSGCKIDKAASGYSLAASSTGLATATSATFTVVSGAATKLAYTQQPSAVVAGASISPAITIAVEDAAGNVVTSSNATVTVTITTNPASGTLSGTTSVQAVAGVATFSDLSIDKAASGYKLGTASAGLSGATSSSFTVSAGAPVQMALTLQPSGGTGGTAWSTQPKVAIQDIFGNTATTTSTSVTLSITPGTGTNGATLTCSSNPRTTSSGVATFAGCKIDRAGTAYTLSVSAPSLPTITTNPFDITVGPAAKLVYVQQPTNAVAGNAISPALAVTVQDAGGNTVTSSTASIAVAISTNPGSGTLSGTASATPVNGVATFANLSIDKSGTGYKLTVSSTGLTSATSSTFNITAAAASQLGFTQQPGGGTAGVAWTTQPKVAVQDTFGNTVTTANASVTLTITPGTGTTGAILTCSANPKATSSGVAAFTSCKIDRAGSGYTLSATATGLAGATSTTITIG